MPALQRLALVQRAGIDRQNRACRPHQLPYVVGREGGRHLLVPEPAITVENAGASAVRATHHHVRAVVGPDIGEIDEELDEAKSVLVEVVQLGRRRACCRVGGRAPPHADQIVDRRRLEIALGHHHHRLVGHKALCGLVGRHLLFVEEIARGHRVVGVEASPLRTVRRSRQQKGFGAAGEPDRRLDLRGRHSALEHVKPVPTQVGERPVDGTFERCAGAEQPGLGIQHRGLHAARQPPRYVAVEPPVGGRVESTHAAVRTSRGVAREPEQRVPAPVRRGSSTRTSGGRWRSVVLASERG